jgi:acyl-CoA reductase-like NAD-dependent aldehyde dehydrogenase
VTEVGFVISEINLTLRQLRQWMKPEFVATNLLNFPSRSYVLREPKGVVLLSGPGIIHCNYYSLHFLEQWLPAIVCIKAKRICTGYLKSDGENHH